MKKLTLVLLIFAVISFFVDAATLYLFSQHCTNALLCVYLVALTYAASWPLLCSIGLLLSLQDLLIFGQMGTQLLYLIPLSIASIASAQVIYPNILQLVCLATVSGLLQTMLIRSFLRGYAISISYTVSTIYGIIVGVLLIFLILRLSGLLGNRMRT